MRRHLPRKLGPKSRKNVLSGFHSFLRWVREQRPTFVVPKFPWPEVDEHQPTILSDGLQALRVRDSDGEFALRVARAAKDHRTRGVVRGLKARNAKTVPVDFFLHDWLLEFVSPERRLQDPEGPLFRNPDGREGGWWSKSALSYTWQQACEKVGVSVNMYEGTKHSTATRLKALGADDRVLAALAGHRDPRSIEKYAKLEPATIASALRRLRDARGK